MMAKIIATGTHKYLILLHSVPTMYRLIALLIVNINTYFIKEAGYKFKANKHILVYAKQV